MELHQEKTRLIEFGRFAERNRKRRGEGNPETFDFLRFIHLCERTRTAGRFTVKRKTIGKRMRAKLQKIRQKLRQRMHDAVPKSFGQPQVFRLTTGAEVAQVFFDIDPRLPGHCGCHTLQEVVVEFHHVLLASLN